MASRRFLGLVLLVLATSWFLTSCAASIAAKSGAAGASQGSSSKNSKSGAKSAPTGSTTGSSKTPPGTGAKIAGGGSKNPGNPGKTNSSLTAFFKAVQKLNETGYTQFASLAKLYGQLQEVSSVLQQPLTLLVPSNKALNKVKLTSYSASQLATIVGYQAIKGVYTFRQLQMLRLNTPVATVALGDDKKPLVLVKASKPNAKNRVVLQGRAAPRSTITIVNGDVFYMSKKLAVHTTDAVVFPNGIL
ncbi:hypothetical protein CLOM_g23209 [Closterium sp. NIES-68]|nr:hypothetical protein CLOM_g23209 [Closterium sp. NIES-68]GJP74610.1 hypothetical protein CLOP_g5169 [Closterium sp. NIES-67]